MKLFLPVAGIIFSIGACCCGNLEEYQQKVDAKQEEVSTPATAQKPDGPKPAASGAAAEGSCGRFKDWSVPAPSGLKVLACSDEGGTGSLVMQGSGSPADACRAIRGWADGLGAKLTTEASMGGTTSLIYSKDSTQIVAACTDATGQTTVSLSLSAM